MKEVPLINEEAFEMNIVRNASTWSERIRRRLPWTRLSRQRRSEVEMELAPIWVIDDDDSEEMKMEESVPPRQVSGGEI